jgi:hypothetical protein
MLNKWFLISKKVVASLLVGVLLPLAAATGATAVGTVLLSGHVTSSGVGVSNAYVLLSGCTASGLTGSAYTYTDPSGYYQLEVLAGCAGYFGIQSDGGRIKWAAGKQNYVAPLVNTTIDFDVPAPVKLNLEATYIDGTPVADVTFSIPNDAVGFPSSLLMTDGQSMNGSWQSGGTCRSISASICEIYVPPNSTMVVTTTANIGAGVEISSDTTLVTENSDVNKTVNFSNLQQLTSSGNAAGVISIVAPAGARITTASNSATQGGVLPAGNIDQTGSISYTISNLSFGASVSITFVLPQGSTPNAAFKLVNGAAIDVTSSVVFSGETVTLTIVDGGHIDSDGLVNGIIVDPVVFTNRIIMVPTAPLAPAAIAGNGQATVTWSAPYNGGSDIDSYTLTKATTQGGIYSATSASCTSINALTCIATGLTNGTTYFFKVVAHNAIGFSDLSGASSAVIPLAGKNPKTPPKEEPKRKEKDKVQCERKRSANCR